MAVRTPRRLRHLTLEPAMHKHVPALATLMRSAIVVVGAIALPAFARCDTAGTSLKHAYADAFLLGTAVNAEIVSGKD
ncbi:hypothetical protein OR60_08750, partial [Xanthomonas vesicatoria]